MSDRALQVGMSGKDVLAWERTLNAQLKTWGIKYRVDEDGLYEAEDRAITASILHGFGMQSATKAMAKGVTPALRVKLRHKNQTPAEKKRFKDRAGWRTDLKRRLDASRLVHSPLARIISDSWGYHPGVHDGVDLICSANAPLLAICRAKVLRSDDSGWWGKGAPSDPAVRGRGDGVIVLQSRVDVGPFEKGICFGYGHAENTFAEVGQTVEAGEAIGNAGFANAWHIHFMVNGGGTTRGVGDRDPRPFIDYAVKNG